jgi:hypothetical protein
VKDGKCGKAVIVRRGIDDDCHAGYGGAFQNMRKEKLTN